MKYNKEDIEIKAPKIISACGMPITYKQLVPEVYIIFIICLL